ncbi:MAG: B12-binding domain-containing radical SAM protein [Deltaproteobacteria bacterium]|nr:B12-binding domain-containing radical SAM protein [Deltaproteobacteria bacterium]
MRILLIDPPYAIFTGFDSRYFPVGLCYVASALKAQGHEVAVFEADRIRPDTGDLAFSKEYERLERYRKEINSDAHLVWQGMASVVKDFNPELIGITSMTMKFGSVVRTARICKAARPDVKIVVGGPHAMDWPEMCLSAGDIDICFSGEAEDDIGRLVHAIAKDTRNLGSIAGTSYRDNGRIVLRRTAPFVEDLNTRPWPAREALLNQQGYTSEDMGVVMTSRGCPFRCGFCSHPPKVRYRGLDNVVAEIKDVAERYGTRQFAIKDDSFTVNRKRTMEFCRLVKREGLDINWDCTTRVNLLDEELLDIMMDAGCNTIKAGIETGSEKIMKEIIKGITFEHVKKAADMMNSRGLFWSAYFMFGLPTETREDMLKTLHFMKEIRPPYAGLGLYVPMPNTKLWEDGVRLGLISTDIKPGHFFNTNPKDYFFKDPKRRVIGMDHEEFSELAHYLMEEFDRYNTGFSRLLRRGWSRKKAYSKDMGLMFKDMKKAARWTFS